MISAITIVFAVLTAVTGALFIGSTVLKEILAHKEARNAPEEAENV